MQTLAVTLVLASAAMHATWNLLAKRSGDPLAFFVALNSAALIFWFIPMLVMLARHSVPAAGLLFMALSAGFHVVYFVALAAGYRHGALSLVYPVARGTGVALVPVLAVLIFQEQLTVPAWIGILGIVGGLGVIGWTGIRQLPFGAVSRDRRGLFYALLTGLSISGYSLIDNAGVSHVHPLVYVYALIFFATMVIAPYVLIRRRAELVRELRDNRLAVAVGGVLSLGTYFIVLVAMQVANVGYVVPLRETSIVFGTLFGVLILREPAGRERIFASLLVGCGAVAIAVWG